MVVFLVHSVLTCTYIVRVCLAGVSMCTLLRQGDVHSLLQHKPAVMYGDCSGRGASLVLCMQAPPHLPHVHAAGVVWDFSCSGRAPDVTADGRLRRVVLLGQYTTQYLNYCTETLQDSCRCVAVSGTHNRARVSLCVGVPVPVCVSQRVQRWFCLLSWTRGRVCQGCDVVAGCGWVVCGMPGRHTRPAISQSTPVALTVPCAMYHGVG